MTTSSRRDFLKHTCGSTAALMLAGYTFSKPWKSRAASFPSLGKPAAPLRSIGCRNGVLVYDDGTEVALWGLNLQTALYWEYMARMKPCGIPLEAAALKKIADDNLAELVQMGANVMRIHLCPADFADAEGNLQDTIFLDLLDYTLARCHERGIYVYLTLINDMQYSYVKDSFITPRESGYHGRKIWLVEDNYIRKTERYIRALLTRQNHYTQRPYKDETAIAVIEIMNEPAYVSYQDMKTNPIYRFLDEKFQAWLRTHTTTASAETKYHEFRSDYVKRYINTMQQVIRSTGARQPVAWNLNWPNMIKGHEDVFQAVADSAVDVVSFCLYPGQSDVPDPYWKHPRDLSGKNYLPFLRANWQHHEQLRWLLDQRFAGKAKAVYEFETFFNQGSYLYPAMARLFRALGAQIANMWTYSLTPTAERIGGSHHLNLYCTPQKAVSFMIAGHVFTQTPRLAPYDFAGDDKLVFGDCAVSFQHNLSLCASADTLMHSHTLGDWQPLPMPPSVKRIIGCGNSPLVSYDGTGIYFIQISGDVLDLRINPDAKFIRPSWENPRGNPHERTCELDSATMHRMELHLPGWRDNLRLVCLDGDRATGTANHVSGGSFEIRPGHYQITRRQ